MSKIVQAANVMLSNSNLITQTSPSNNDDDHIFFVYNEKHKWSIILFDGIYILNYYPSSDSLEDIIEAYHSQDEYDKQPVVSYDTEDLGTREAKETFKELHTTVKEKVHGVDDALDDIINNTPPF